MTMNSLENRIIELEDQVRILEREIEVLDGENKNLKDAAEYGKQCLSDLEDYIKIFYKTIKAKF